MNPDRWEEYSGPLCDDPGERGEYAEPVDDRGALWEELAPSEREYLTRMGLR